jgi:hypothetical protein
MDGFCNQNADHLGYLAGPSLLTVYVGVVEFDASSLSPVSSSLTHARRMDGFCNQNADQFCSLAGPSLLTVHVGVVECASASPYTYSSSTHRFSDELTPIEATPLSATSALRSLVCGGQPSPHKPLFVLSHSTCPPLSSSPHSHSFVLGTAVINTHEQRTRPPRRAATEVGDRSSFLNRRSCVRSLTRPINHGSTWM